MKKGFLAILVLAAIGLTGLFGFIYVTEDRQGPEIIVPDAEVTYVEGEDTTKLLEGVTAKDNRDGDVTASVCVEKVQFDEESETGYVIYAAKDSNNNISKAKRFINVEVNKDSEEPEKETAEETAKDEAAEETKEEETVQEPEESPGEAANEAAIEALAPEAPRFYLTEYEVTVEAGSEFYGLDYVSTIEDDVDSIDTLSLRIQIVGEVNTAVPGTYELEYYVIDSDQNMSNRAVLTVTVE